MESDIVQWYSEEEVGKLWCPVIKSKQYSINLPVDCSICLGIKFLNIMFKECTESHNMKCVLVLALFFFFLHTERETHTHPYIYICSSTKHMHRPPPPTHKHSNVHIYVGFFFTNFCLDILKIQSCD